MRKEDHAMAGRLKRTKILFLPTVRGKAYDLSLTKTAKAALRRAAAGEDIDAIFPADDAFTEGLIAEDAEAWAYAEQWRGNLADVKALIVFSSDFMRETVVQDTMRELPADVPVFLMLNNDVPADMVNGKMGDGLCGSLSVHHNARMLGRRIVQSCRINMNDATCVRDFLSRYVCIINGVEGLRNMRVGMIGSNPDKFATTFTNQLKLFELGFSLKTYELLTLWGDTVPARELRGEESTVNVSFGELRLSNPIRKDDPRVEETIERIKGEIENPTTDSARLDVMARCFLWVQDTFERDHIDTATIHCWPEFSRFFGMAPCGFAMLSNLWLRRPVVCEGDICHAIMARLAWDMTDECGVILDINNNGWDPRVFNVFHCSQTPTTWIEGGAGMGDWGSIEGRMAPLAFTGVSAATTSDAFKATVFQGQFLKEDAGLRGTSGWAFVPNFPEVLSAVEGAGIHHFVAMNGHLGNEVAEALRFRGLEVEDLSCEVGGLDEIRRDLPEMGTGPVRVFSS